MWVLAMRLKRAGHRPSLFGYFVALESFERIVLRFQSHVGLTLAEDAEEGLDMDEWGVIGHSLGNVITRRASPGLPEGFSRFAMIAPPNRLPTSALKLRDNFFFRKLTGEAGQRISDPSFYDDLPAPDVPTLVIAGDRGPSWEWLPYDGPHDGIVQVEETRLDGAPLLRLHALHTFLMNRKDLFLAVRDFLDHGDAERVVREHSDEGAISAEAGERI